MKNKILLLSLYVQPNARHDKVVGLFNGEIKVQITAPAVDNKANLHLQKWLANEFDVPKSAVVLVKGEHSRHKTFRIVEPRRRPAWVDEYTPN